MIPVNKKSRVLQDVLDDAYDNGWNQALVAALEKISKIMSSDFTSFLKILTALMELKKTKVTNKT